MPFSKKNTIKFIIITMLITLIVKKTAIIGSTDNRMGSK